MLPINVFQDAGKRFFS